MCDLKYLDKKANIQYISKHKYFSPFQRRNIAKAFEKKRNICAFK